MNILVEKFGGASVNSAKAVINVAHILSDYDKYHGISENDADNTEYKKFIIISAMGKTTNKLEEVVNSWYKIQNGSDDLIDFCNKKQEELRKYHKDIVKELIFGEDSDKYYDFSKKDESKKNDWVNKICNHIDNLLDSMNALLKNKNFEGKNCDYDMLYDSIVSYGERISTYIVSQYLNLLNEWFDACHLQNILIDASSLIKTDNNFRDAAVDWHRSEKAIQEKINTLPNNVNIFITQGFIGGTDNGMYTTLGREGSDYSAAIISNCLNAKRMTVWKDVPGMQNADPKRMKETVKIKSLPYTEAVELSYYGAEIIHPKTVKPLENKKIPLYIKSFLNPQQQGTVINDSQSVNPIVPNYIFKDNQILLSLQPKDLSFATESNISKIFSTISKHKVKVNLMQNSAVSFSVCFTENRNTLDSLIKDLEQDFSVKYNTDLQLITIRHYTDNTIKEITQRRRILIEQKSRVTAQFLVIAPK